MRIVLAADQAGFALKEKVRGRPADVLTLNGPMLDAAPARQIVDARLSTPLAGESHQRWLEKIEALDQRYHLEKRA